MQLYNHNKHAHIPPIIIDNHIIEYSSHIKNLGIILDPQLSFTQYITNISKSINQILHSIRMIRPSITKELAQLLVVLAILPKLDYCNSTLNSIPQYSIKRLNSLQYSCDNILHIFSTITETRHQIQSNFQSSIYPN